VIDSLEHRTAAHADVLLPAATGPESDGTLVNQEGRAQRFYQVFVPEGDVTDSWRWVRDLARAQSQQTDSFTGVATWSTLDEAIAATAAAAPELARIGEVAPSASFRVVGQKIPRQPDRYSGRTSILSHLTVHEPPPPPDPDTPLGFTMEGHRGPLPSPLIPQFWAPGWNSIQAVNKYQEEVGGPLREEMPGLRLIEPIATTVPNWFTAIPHVFQPISHQWLLLPLTALFGSEELSNQASAIAERISEPFLSLHPSDGARLNLDDRSTIELAWQGTTYRLGVDLDSSTPMGTAGLSIRSDASGVRVPVWIDLFKAIKAGQKRRVA